MNVTRFPIHTLTSAPSPHDEAIFGPNMPEWVDSFRSNQWDIVTQIMRAFEDVDVVFLQAPTGTGKSLIGESVRRLMAGDSVYACSTKALQDQFTHDFPYAKVIKGRSNYLTQSGAIDQFGNQVRAGKEWSAVTCADCTFTPSDPDCNWCDSQPLCPYVTARNTAEAAELAVLNTSYLFTVSKNMGASRFLNRRLAILDEADLLETELLGHVEVTISKRLMDKMRLGPPAKKTKDESWLEWITITALPTIRKYLASLGSPGPQMDLQTFREHRRISDLIQRLRAIEEELKVSPKGSWVYDGYDSGNVIFRPVKVGKYGAELLWPHAEKFLLMSATVLSADLMAEELGLSTPYELVDIPSNFPIENRQINVVPVADMAYKNRDTAWPAMVQAIRSVLARHPDERCLVHCVSYELARYITGELTSSSDVQRPVISYTSSQEKAAALDRYLSHPQAVMVAASMDRGIDLPDDKCRVQIVAKIPYPNVKDKRISARMYSAGGQAWYRMQTVRSLIQMTGRGVRSDTDYATTYILDKQFLKLNQNKSLFPIWWSEALNFSFSPRRLLSGG